MAKLRHIAMQVPNLQESAAYYEKLFDLDRVCDVESEYGNAIMLSDGTMNLTLLHFPEGTKGGRNGPDWAGLHHIGFIVDDKEATANKAVELGGEFFMELPDNIPRRRRRDQIQGPQRAGLRHRRSRLDPERPEAIA